MLTEKTPSAPSAPKSSEPARQENFRDGFTKLSYPPGHWTEKFAENFKRNLREGAETP